MAEPAPPSDRPAYGPPPPRPRGGRPLAWLFALLLLAAAGYGGWRAWQWGTGAWQHVVTDQDTLARLTRDVAALRAQSGQLAAALQGTQAQLTELGGRVGNGEQALARLSDTVEGGRARLQLAAVEQLLLMANDRLLLAHDVAGAQKALDFADQRLALLSDPRLFKVREALAQERTALAALALPDFAGATLALAETIRRVPQMPLRVQVPAHFEVAAPALAPPQGDGVLARIWAAVQTALSNVFALRRTDPPAPRLLAPEEAVLVQQVLELKLEGARLALLAGDGRTFADLAAGARAWLGRYYDETDPNVRAAGAELDRLRGMNLAPALPDISRGLALLRAAMGAPAR